MDLRVALVGYGLAGRDFHGPLVRATPGLAVTAVVTSDPERRGRAARDFPTHSFSTAPTTSGRGVTRSTALCWPRLRELTRYKGAAVPSEPPPVAAEDAVAALDVLDRLRR